MIEAHADARRLTSIAAATWLGRLADEVVIALTHSEAGRPPAAQDQDALRRMSEWLELLGRELADPLDVSRIGAQSGLPGLQGFGPDIAEVAIEAIGTAGEARTGAEAIQYLRTAVDRIANGTVDGRLLEPLMAIFETIARAMLSTADSMLDSGYEAMWPKIAAF